LLADVEQNLISNFSSFQLLKMDAQKPNKIGLKGDEKNHLRLQRKQHIGGYFEIV
jgi:hypothetical protein